MGYITTPSHPSPNITAIWRILFYFISFQSQSAFVAHTSSHNNPFWENDPLLFRRNCCYIIWRSVVVSNFQIERVDKSGGGGGRDRRYTDTVITIYPSSSITRSLLVIALLSMLSTVDKVTVQLIMIMIMMPMLVMALHCRRKAVSCCVPWSGWGSDEKWTVFWVAKWK